MRSVIACVVLGLVLWASPASAQSCESGLSLTLARPLATGAAGSGWDADNRIYRAYQGIQYQFRVQVSGGCWPYTFALSGQPTGMTVSNAGAGETCGIAETGLTHVDCGVIAWPDPQATDASITLTVTDADSTQVTATWGVTVSTTACGSDDGWCFIDSVNGNDTTGDGSLSTPWASIQKVWDTVSADSNVLYFRTGTYGVTGMTQTQPGDCFQQVAWNEATRPVAWLAYPGETATIDFNWDAGGTNAPCMEFVGANIWLEGLSVIDVRSIGWQFNVRSSDYGAYVWRMTFDGLTGGVDGSNSAFVMWSSNDNGSYFDYVGEVTASGVTVDACVLKLYGVNRLVLEDFDISDNAPSEGAIALKNNQVDFDIRGIKCAADVTTCIGGNMNESTSGATSGDMHHNLVLGAGTGLSDGTITYGVAKVASVGAMRFYRNTLIGKVNIQDLVTADGPGSFGRNVIENAGGSGSPTVCADLRATCANISDSTRIVDNGDNLVGASLVDAGGALEGANRTTYLGTRGYELGTGGAASPSAPRRLRIRGEH